MTLMHRPERRSVRPSRNGGNHRVTHREVSASETAAEELLHNVIAAQTALPIRGPWKQYGLTAQKREKLDRDRLKRVFLFRVVLMSGTAFSADITVFSENRQYNRGTAAITMTNTPCRGQRCFFHWSRDLESFDVRGKANGRIELVGDHSGG